MSANSPYQRTDRVSDVIKKEVADILVREVKDPRLQFVTITHVRISKDLRHARIFYSSIKSGQELEDIRSGLKRACGYVQKKLGERIQLRNTPHIVFDYDATVDSGAHMDRVLRNIEQELAAGAGHADADDEA
jgi:ribosome-binding factor A